MGRNPSDTDSESEIEIEPVPIARLQTEIGEVENASVQNELDSWESEDEIPLSELRKIYQEKEDTPLKYRLRSYQNKKGDAMRSGQSHNMTNDQLAPSCDPGN